MTRMLLAGLGAILLAFGGYQMLVPRARLVTATPAPGSTLSRPPAEVVLRFSQPLGEDSRLTVGPTFTLDAAGEPVYGQDRDVTVRGPDPGDPVRRTLRAKLEPGFGRGLYRYDWRTTTARDRAGRYGTAYFGVGLPVPGHILRDNPGAKHERDVKERQNRSALLGGVILLLFGVLLPKSRRRLP